MQLAQRYRRQIGTIAAIVGIVGSLGLPSLSTAAERQAQGSDPVGDQADGRPSSYDIKLFRVAYDDVVGSLSAQLSLAGDLPTVGGLGIGQVKIGNARNDGSCEHKVVIGSGLGTLAPLTRWGPDSNPTQYPAMRMLLDPATIAMTASHPDLIGGDYDCAQAQTVAGLAIIDSTVSVPLGIFASIGDESNNPSTEVDSPPQTDDGMRTVTLPTPIPETGEQLPSTPTASAVQLTLSSKWPQRLTVGRWLRVTVTVRNVGGTAARNVRVRIKPPKKVATLKRSRKLGTLAANASRKVRFRVRVGSKVRNGARLTLSVSATGHKTVLISDKIQIRRSR